MKNYKYCDINLIAGCLALDKKRRIFMRSRDSFICPLMVTKIINVYNGKIFKDLFITPEHCGFRLGEFLSTRSLSFRTQVKKRHQIKIKKSDKFIF